jgi:hypothetical protein
MENAIKVKSSITAIDGGEHDLATTWIAAVPVVVG